MGRNRRMKCGPRPREAMKIPGGGVSRRSSKTLPMTCLEGKSRYGAERWTVGKHLPAIRRLGQQIRPLLHPPERDAHSHFPQ